LPDLYRGAKQPGNDAGIDSTLSLIINEEGNTYPASALVMIALFALAVLGLLVLLVSDWRGTIVTITPTVAYAIPTFAASLAQFGFVLPLLPTVCLSAGKGFEVLRSSLPWTAGERLAAPGLLILALVSPLLLVSCCDQVRAQRPTTQEKTAEWIREHIPAGARILGTATGISLPLAPARLSELLAEATRARPAGGARIPFCRG
jgi:hypothetical protein